MRLLILFSVVVTLISCQENKHVESIADTSDYYKEMHRPQYHFSPEANWMNDPNGMVYLDGEYHLFYQYYPDSTVWGPMHWGHAISEDLVHWEHLPIALYPDSLGWIFSGSAVYDKDNTSGLGMGGEGPLVAIFSHHSQKVEMTGSDKFQYQSIAYSNDKGRTWTMYEGNPVLPNPGIRDFRDPKVIWHDASEQWVMALATLYDLAFYGSPDLKSWELLSKFGTDLGSHEGVWECPDLFPITDDKGNERWVIIQNMNPGNPNGGSGVQYFIGDFDGKKFKVDDQFMKLLKPIPASTPQGIIFEDFTNGYQNWELEGEAFNHSSPADHHASSIATGVEEVGVITSKSFKIEKPFINFKIGGGNHRGRTCMALVIDGKYVREVDGHGEEELKWRGWNVSAYKGKEAQLKIIDKHSGEWGYIMVDEITFADEIANEEQSGSVWLDAGRDNYAGVTWSNVPDGRRIFIGWLSNWAYAQVVPTEKWRSAMTLPTVLDIVHIDGIPRLKMNPVKELKSIVAGDKKAIDLKAVNDLDNGLAKIELQFDKPVEESIGFRISNDKNEHIYFAYNPKNNVFSLDRRQSGDVSFSADFPSISKVQRIQNADKINVVAYLDHSSIEIFIDDGLNVFTEIFFPSQPFDQLTIINGKGSGTKVSGSIQAVERIWGK